MAEYSVGVLCCFSMRMDIYLSAVEELRGVFDGILRSDKGSLAVRRREQIGSGFAGIAVGVKG